MAYFAEQLVQGLCVYSTGRKQGFEDQTYQESSDRMVLTGLWHGAAWNFVAWGLYYGVILIIEKYLLSPVLDRLPDVVRHIYSIVLVVIGWVLFFSSSFGQAADYIRVMFGAGAHGFADRESMYLLTSNLILWLILIFGSTPLVHFRYEHMLRSKNGIQQSLTAWYMLCCLLSVLHIW